MSRLLHQLRSSGASRFLARVGLCIGLVCSPLLAADVRTEVNAAIREGRWDRAQQLLEKAAAGGSDPLARKMLEGLRARRSAGKQAAGSSSSSPVPAAPAAPAAPAKPPAPAAAAKPPYRAWSLKDRQAWITNVGSYQDNWSIVFSAWNQGRKAPWTEQRLIESKEFPSGELGGLSQRGHHITTLTGDGGGWLIVTSKPSGYKDQVIFQGGKGLPQTEINDYHKRGWHITALAGWKDSWVVVMSEGMPWGRQRFNNPGRWPLDWISARKREGYAITSAAGDTDAEGMESYAVVMTQGTSTRNQVESINVRDDRVEADMRANLNAGMVLQNATGFRGKRYLVYSSRIPYRFQSFHLGPLADGGEPFQLKSTISTRQP